MTVSVLVGVFVFVNVGEAMAVRVCALVCVRVTVGVRDGVDVLLAGLSVLVAVGNAASFGE